MSRIFRWFTPWLFFSVLGAEAAPKPIVLSVPIAPEMSTYVDSLARQPSYAALVFRNAGIPLSFSKTINIDSSTSFRLGSYAVQYVKKADNIYFYELQTITDLGRKVVTPVEIDVTKVSDGALQIRIYPEFADFVPKILFNQLDSRLRSISRPSSQKKLVNYLAVRSKNSRTMTDSERQRIDRK